MEVCRSKHAVGDRSTNEKELAVCAGASVAEEGGHVPQSGSGGAGGGEEGGDDGASDGGGGIDLLID